MSVVSRELFVIGALDRQDEGWAPSPWLPRVRTGCFRHAPLRITGHDQPNQTTNLKFSPLQIMRSTKIPLTDLIVTESQPSSLGTWFRADASDIRET